MSNNGNKSVDKEVPASVSQRIRVGLAFKVLSTAGEQVVQIDKVCEAFRYILEVSLGLHAQDCSGAGNCTCGKDRADQVAVVISVTGRTCWDNDALLKKVVDDLAQETVVSD